MSGRSKDQRPRPQAGDARKARLSDALKANLARRKAQARARAEGPDDDGGAGADTSGERDE